MDFVAFFEQRLFIILFEVGEYVESNIEGEIFNSLRYGRVSVGHKMIIISNNVCLEINTGCF